MKHPSREEFIITASMLALAGAGGRVGDAMIIASEAKTRAEALAKILDLKSEAEIVHAEAEAYRQRVDREREFKVPDELLDSSTIGGEPAREVLARGKSARR